MKSIAVINQFFTALLILVTYTYPIFAESRPTQILITPATDSSSQNLEQTLQNTLFTSFKDTKTYNPITTDIPLSGFGSAEVNQALEQKGASALSFALLEPRRISVFLFDRNHPDQFIVSSEILDDSLTASRTTPYITEKLKKAFYEVIRLHGEENYQDINRPKGVPSQDTDSKLKDREVKTIRYFIGPGQILGGSSTYKMKSSEGLHLLTIERNLTEKNRLHFVLGSSQMFNNFFGYELLSQLGTLKASGLGGSDLWLALHLCPRIEFRLLKNIRLWGTLGLGINMVVNSSWYKDGTGSIFPDNGSKFALGFSQGLGLQVDLTDKYFVGLNAFHQAFSVNNLNGRIIATAPASTTDIKLDITYDTWLTFFNLGIYFN